MSKSIDRSAQALQSAATTGAESAAALHRSGQAIVDATTAFQESQGRVETVWGDYQKRFETVDNALGNTFKELDTGLQGYSRNIREFIQQLDEHTGKITSSLAGAVEDLSGGIEDLGDVLNRRAA